jgi:hypothetical protein
MAAHNIAEVCRGLLAEETSRPRTRAEQGAELLPPRAAEVAG